MKYIRNLIILAIAIFGFSSVNAQAQQYYAVGKNASTTDIERKVRHEILMLPYYGVFDSIGYRLEGNTVILSGKVVQPTTKKDAGRAVNKIEGVSNVVNNIEVLPLSNFDDSIRVSALRTFAAAGGVSRYFQSINPPVRIIVNNGRLTLEGFVATRADYDYLNILARGIPGVFSVENKLIVEKGRL